jgi:hypothetical protein
MDTPVLHRKWAREYLTRAEHARSNARKCRFLQLAVRNTVDARKLEAQMDGPSNDRKVGSARRGQTPKR